LTPSQVIELDTSLTPLALACHNAVLYDLAARIELVLTEFRTFTHCLLYATSTNGTSARWSTPEYLSGLKYSLARTQPEPATELFRLTHLTLLFMYRGIRCWKRPYLHLRLFMTMGGKAYSHEGYPLVCGKDMKRARKAIAQVCTQCMDTCNTVSSMINYWSGAQLLP
jgi:hypothetical protein